MVVTFLPLTLSHILYLPSIHFSSCLPLVSLLSVFFLLVLFFPLFVFRLQPMLYTVSHVCWVYSIITCCHTPARRLRSSASVSPSSNRTNTTSLKSQVITACLSECLLIDSIISFVCLYTLCLQILPKCLLWSIFFK